MSGISKAVLLSLHLHQQNHRLYLGFWAFICAFIIFLLCNDTATEPNYNCFGSSQHGCYLGRGSGGDLATKSGRISVILYKGVLTNFVSSSENSAETCLCEVALPEYIFPGKYSPDWGTAFSFSVFRWLVFTNLSRLTIAAGVTPGIRLTAPICTWRQEQVNYHQTYTLHGASEKWHQNCGCSFPWFFHPPAPWGRQKGFHCCSALLWLSFSPSGGGLHPASPAPLPRVRHQWQSNPGHLAAGAPHHDAPLPFPAADWLHTTRKQLWWSGEQERQIHIHIHVKQVTCTKHNEKFHWGGSKAPKEISSLIDYKA